jgi:chromosome segregation ATPase
VLVFIMSVVFATFALAVYSTQTNWLLIANNDKPPEIEKKGLFQRLEKAKKEYDELQAQKKKLEDQCKVEKERQDRALAALETERQRALQVRAADEQKVAALEKELGEVVSALQKQNETLAALRAETDQLRKNIAAAQADRKAQLQRLVELTDELNNAVVERMRLQAICEDLGKQLKEARAAVPASVGKPAGPPRVLPR